MVTIKRCDNCGSEGASSSELIFHVLPPKGQFGATTIKRLSCDLCGKCYEKAAKFFKQPDEDKVEIVPGPLQVAK